MMRLPLADICSIRSGGTPSKSKQEYWVGSIPWVSPKDMKTSSIADATDHISDVAIEASAANTVPPGSILVVVRSGVLAHTFPVARTLTRVSFNQDIKAIIPNADLVDPEYLFWFVRSKAEDVVARGIKKGATVHSVISGFLERFEIPLPSRDKQRCIVDMLSRAEGIVRLRHEAQAKVAELVPALFLDMFGDPTSNPKGWPVAALGELCDVQGGLQVTRKRAGYPLERIYLRVANVHRGFLDLSELKTIRLTAAELQRTRLRHGDLLFVEGHGNAGEVGRVAVWDGSINDCTHQNHLIRARPDVGRIHPAFVCTLLNTPSGRTALTRVGKTTSGLSTISAQNVKDAQVILPPIELQCQFAAKADAVRSIVSQQDAAMEKARATFDSLLQRTFAA